MRLEPVYADGGGASNGGPPATSATPGSLRINPEKQQLMGIATTLVERTSRTHTVRTTGRVAPDENRVYRLNASTELWIRRVYAPTTGALVRKGDALLDFYTTNFLSSATAYMYALNTRDRQKAANPESPAQGDALNYQVRQAIETLQNLGVSEADITEMERTRKPRNLVTLRSPADGYILTRAATLGQWVGTSGELYQIADLSRVWILSDLFEHDSRYVRPGQMVRVLYQGRVFHARTSEVPPQFDPGTRTLKARLEMDNPGHVLRPGMFVDVEFPVELPPAVTIPADAMIDSGLRKTVFVDLGSGHFEPRLIETGWRFGDHVEVTRGLDPGERIVVAGNFLLDSESRMRTAAAAPEGPAKDPVCGMNVNRAEAKSAGRTSQYRGATCYFCSDHCKKQFDKEPAKYLKKPEGSKPHSGGGGVNL